MQKMFLESCFECIIPFITSVEVHNLKVINKYWNKKIPKDWIKEKIDFNHPKDTNISVPKQYKFVSFVQFVFIPNVQTINIPENLEHIEALYISRGKNLVTCTIPKHLTFLHIDNCPNLGSIEIPMHIRVLQLMGMNLTDSFSLQKTWNNLTTVSLTNSDIYRLFIPKELEELNYINISGTNISEIIFEKPTDSKERKEVEIFSYAIRSTLHINTNGVPAIVFSNPTDVVTIIDASSEV